MHTIIGGDSVVVATIKYMNENRAHPQLSNTSEHTSFVWQSKKGWILLNRRRRYSFVSAPSLPNAGAHTNSYTNTTYNDINNDDDNVHNEPAKKKVQFTRSGMMSGSTLSAWILSIHNVHAIPGRLRTSKSTIIIWLLTVNVA